MKDSFFIGLCTVVMALTLYGSACAGALDTFQGEKGEINIAGGTAHIPVMKEAAARIMTLSPDIRISIAGGGVTKLAGPRCGCKN